MSEEGFGAFRPEKFSPSLNCELFEEILLFVVVGLHWGNGEQFRFLESGFEGLF